MNTFMSSAIRKLSSSPLVLTVKKAYPILICKDCPIYNHTPAIFGHLSCGMCEMLRTPEWTMDHIVPRESMANYVSHIKTRSEKK